MSLHHYELHGVILASELELDAHPAPDSATVDYVVKWGEVQAATGQPEGLLISEINLPGVSSWLVERGRADGPSELLLRVDGVAEFEIGNDQITVCLALGAPPGYAAILLTGTVLSRLLGLAGRLVLHASAVELEGGGIALLGDSGMGKSTTAAHLCLAGAPLVTDDALAIEVSGNDGPRCFRGTHTIRLREAARLRFDGIEPWLQGATADERLALRPPSTEQRSLPLRAAVVIERPEGHGELAVERLVGVDAAAQLLRYPRSFGWVDPDCLRSQFDLTALLAGRVPVLVARLPETAGAVDRGQLGAQLLEAITAALPGYPAAAVRRRVDA